MNYTSHWIQLIYIMWLTYWEYWSWLAVVNTPDNVFYSIHSFNFTRTSISWFRIFMALARAPNDFLKILQLFCCCDYLWHFCLCFCFWYIHTSLQLTNTMKITVYSKESYRKDEASEYRKNVKLLHTRWTNILACFSFFPSS